MTVQNMSVDMPIGRIVLDYPQTRSLFEKLRIDYPCSGGQPLFQAALQAGMDPDSIVNQLEGILGRDPEPSYPPLSLTDICCQIVNVHHTHLKNEIPGLKCLFCKLLKNGSKVHLSMLKRLNDHFESLLTGLEIHLSQQEEFLFPQIAKLECIAAGRCTESDFEKESLEAAISQHKRLHLGTVQVLSDMRDLTEDFSWLDASNSAFRTLYGRLAAFEDDLHLHIHYENNLLFPQSLLLSASLTL